MPGWSYVAPKEKERVVTVAAKSNTKAKGSQLQSILNKLRPGGHIVPLGPFFTT